MPTIDSALDVITAVPFLIGFHPHNSLVVISAKRDAIGLVMRIDLPATLESDAIDLLAHHLLRDNAEGAICIAYVPDTRPDGDSMLIALTAGLVRNDVKVHDAIVVAGGRYKSLMCRDENCCAIDGQALPIFEESEMALEHVISGIPMPFQSIDEMSQTISPLTFTFDEEWISLVQRYSFDDLAPNCVELRRDGVAAMEEMFEEFRVGVGASDRVLAARIIGRMQEIQVRDYAMGIHNEDTFDIYFSMWRELLRMAPVGSVASIACIVAAMSYENGDGAMAQKALDRALADDPEYSLALLLRRVFNAGWPPSEFVAMRAELHPRVIETIFG
jgi:hypothetical protein